MVWLGIVTFNEIFIADLFIYRHLFGSKISKGNKKPPVSG